jgi:hypothetical protein
VDLVADIVADDQGKIYVAKSFENSVLVFEGVTASKLGSIENINVEALYFDTSNRELDVVVGGPFLDNNGLRVEPQYVSTGEFAPIKFSTIAAERGGRSQVFDLNGQRYEVHGDGSTRNLRSVEDPNISYPLSGVFAAMSFDENQNLYYFDFFSGIQRVSVDGQTQKIDRPAEHQSPVTDMQYVPFLSRFKTGGEEKPPLTIRDITRITREVFDGRVRDELDFNVSGSVTPGELIHFFEAEGVKVGDIDLDGTFGSKDLIDLFQQGRYEAALAVDSDWSNGDFNGDRKFTSGDLNLAFEAGKYEQTPPRGALGVPEPSGLALLLCGYIVALAYRRAGK